MITKGDLMRFLNPIKRRLYLLFGRAILTAMDNSGESQIVQITLLKDETVTDIERMQDFGFDSVPPVDTSDAIVGFINGNRDHGVILKMQTKSLRPKDLVKGETAIYSAKDKEDGHRIHLKDDGTTENISGSSKIVNQNGKVALGVTGKELVDLVEQTLAGIELLTVPTSVGPSGVPINAATFTAIKASVTAIKGTI